MASRKKRKGSKRKGSKKSVSPAVVKRWKNALNRLAKSMK